MARRLTLVAMLAVALAGCNAVSSATTAGPEDPVTPLSVPTDTPVPGPEFSAPPGIAANGSVDTAALGRAHRAALGEQSFTWTVAFEQRALDSEVRVDGVEKRLQVGPEGAYLIRTQRSVRERQILYADDDRTYSRIVLNNRSVDRSLDTTIDYRHYLTTEQSLGTYLSTGGASIDRVDRRGQRFYRIHVTSPPEALRDGHPKQTIHNYTATAYVTASGLVRTLVVHYDYTLRNDHLAVTRRAEYDMLGETTVERPAWAGGPAPGPSSTAATDSDSPAQPTAPSTDESASARRSPNTGTGVEGDR